MDGAARCDKAAVRSARLYEHPLPATMRESCDAAISLMPAAEYAGSGGGPPTFPRALMSADDARGAGAA